MRSRRIGELVAASLLLLALGTVGAIQAGRAGASFMYDLELDVPPLAHLAPAVPDPHTPRLARRVFVVIIDGLRFDRSYGLPFLDEVRRRGVDLEAQSHYPTWSRPNYVSILTGVPPIESGVRTNRHYKPVAVDTLMDRAHAAGLTVAAVTDYAALPLLFLRPSSPADLDAVDLEATLEATIEPPTASAPTAPDAPLRTAFDDARYVPWPGGFSEAGASVAGGGADLVVLLVSPVDIAGHAHGADSPEYRAAAEAADRALARVLGRVDLEQDAIVITADHGHTGRGGHGGVEPEVLSVPLIAAGAGIDRAGTVVDAYLIDIAPTVAALLGIAAPGHGLGRTLTEILRLDPAAAALRRTADAARLAVTRAAVARIDANARTSLDDTRLARLAVVAVGALLGIALALALHRRRLLRIELKVVACGAPVFLFVYFTLIGTLGQKFSPSLVPAQGDVARALLRYAAIGVVMQLAASLWALRAKPTLARRLTAANGIAWTGLMATMIPAGLLWAYFPPPYQVVPGPFWLVVIPATEIAVACAAINVALALVVEVIVFAARLASPRTSA